MTLAGASWIVGGLVVAALEMLAPGVFLLWIGMGALVAGVVTEMAGLFGGRLGWPGQVGVFVVATVGLVGAAAWRLRGRARTGNGVNTPAGGLVGQTCRAVAFRDGEGRVALGDGTWAARVAGEAQPEPGDALLVTGLEGTTLLVARR